jgi:GntR family transcriptional regulator
MNFRSKSILYIEIVEYYKKYINSGIIRVDEKLPSVRTLAYELGVNPNTVQKAYSILEKEEYIRTLPKKGVYVINRKQETSFQDAFTKELALWKSKGLTKNMLEEAIEQVYKGEHHD